MTEEIEYKEMEKLNPFFSIWLSTRRTIRYVLENKDLKYSLMIAAIAGAASGISAFGELNKSLEIQWWLMLVLIVLIGPVFSLVGLYICAAIYTWVGKWFGGTGRYKEMLQAIGAAMITNIWMIPFWILSVIFVRNGLFTMDIIAGISIGTVVWFLVSSLITITFSIWMIVIQSKAIGEVHQFSSGKGFATLIIPSIIIGIIVFVITLIVIFSIIGMNSY
ncbi:YIP1 family protein [Bacillus sp. FJAT-22090]|uniref:YIP1 family protein n=1 Tax=Bacillus sp. FJAT-22090 TaxID=1581038 RepID=UPI0011A80EE0|nr:YIP1 family protein [Bacillus sp. FJAT-22090]